MCQTGEYQFFGQQKQVMRKFLSYNYSMNTEKKEILIDALKEANKDEKYTEFISVLEGSNSWATIYTYVDSNEMNDLIVDLKLTEKDLSTNLCVETT